MSDRNAWGQYVDKGEAGTMRAEEIERQDALRRQREEEDRLAREHQRQMEAQWDRQRQSDRQGRSRRKTKTAPRSSGKQTKRPGAKPAVDVTASIGKLALFLAVVAGIFAYSDPQLQPDALVMAIFVLVASFIGLHVLYYALRTAFVLVKWALVVAGIVLVFHLLAVVVGNA